MASFFSANPNILFKKSLSLGFWIKLFIYFQVIAGAFIYLLKKTGPADSSLPFYYTIITGSIMLLGSLFFLSKQGVNLEERLQIYYQHAGQDLLVALLFAASMFLLMLLMEHYNVHGRVFSHNSTILGGLFSNPGGQLHYDRFALAIIGFGLIGPIAEELFYRRLLYVTLRLRYGLWICLGINSILFGLIHPDAVFFSILYGFTMCLMFERYGRISINAASHIIFNCANLICIATRLLD